MADAGNPRRRPLARVLRVLLVAVIGAVVAIVALALIPVSDEGLSGSEQAVSTPSEAAQEPADDPAMIGYEDLNTGDCLRAPAVYTRDPASHLEYWTDRFLPEVSSTIAAVAIVACDDPHGAEVFFRGDLWDADTAYPGDENIRGQVITDLEEKFESYVGVPYRDSRFESAYLYPSAESWAEGDREVVFVAYDLEGENVEETIEASGR